METWINIHTGKRVKVRGSKLVSNFPSPIRVFVMEDWSFWQENDFVNHHQRLSSDMNESDVDPIVRTPTEA